MANKEDKVKKAKTPMDKRKLIQSIVIIILIAAMLLSVAATLIYYLLNM